MGFLFAFVIASWLAWMTNKANELSEAIPEAK